MSERPDCPACDGTDLVTIYQLEAIPVQSCILLDTEKEARAFPRAPLLLKACDGCGFVFNALFDPSLVDYASVTEESQHFSCTFNRFAEGLVSDIAARHDLEGRFTLEIGCGKGDFLQALVRGTGTRGLGVDPGFIPQRLSGVNGHEIRFQREYFDPDAIEVPPDFVVCRHTLEHVPEVARFMADVARVIDGRGGIFFETPDVERVLREGAFWDIYYEHCSYFTCGSHARLFRRAGLDVTGLELAYDDQYIILFARPGRGQPLPPEKDLQRMRALVRAFPARVAKCRAHWRNLVRARHAAGRRVAIWGGGSKGVSFLTTNGLQDEVAQVVDINPYKQGKYLPGTGHRVIAPEVLAAEPPHTVIAMNPIYRDEISVALTDLGIEAELLAVGA